MDKEQKVFRDTSNFISIGPGDYIEVADQRFLVKGEQRENRFGIEDPKFWVKNAIDCNSQERKILKLYYLETFSTQLGGVKIPCYRNPWKEGEILKLVEGHPSFMQGKTYTDSVNNPVRVSGYCPWDQLSQLSRSVQTAPTKPISGTFYRTSSDG